VGHLPRQLHFLCWHRDFVRNKSHQPRLRVVACEQKTLKSGWSGSSSRASNGTGNSHGGNRQVDAQKMEESRVGAVGVHPFDFIREEKREARQESRANLRSRWPARKALRYLGSPAAGLLFFIQRDSAPVLPIY
jgi:hypothetical protein